MVMIFIGHARQDTDAAAQIEKALRDQGYTVHTGAAVAVGSNWREASENTIRAADAYIYLHSPEANISPWLQNEVLFAIRHQKPIIPVILAPVAIPQALLNFQFIDATEGIDAALQRIALAVDAVTSLPPVQTQRARTAEMRRALPPEAPAPRTAAPALKRGRSRWRLILAVLLIVTFAAFVTLFIVSPTMAPSYSAATQTAEVPRTPLPPTPTLPVIFPGLTATWGDITSQGSEEERAIQIAVAATVSAVRATEEHSLSPAELTLIAPLTQQNHVPLLFTGLIAALSLGISGTALYVVFRTGARHSPLRRAHSPHHGNLDQAHIALPTPLLADFQVFVSSSEKDREWVERLIEDLQTMGYLVWWYAKDAPGLPFGNEIRSAIYHTKVFMIVLSPDSMQSKHVEEEIRWAEIYDRPIVPILYRPVSIEERFYGLAKGADIDFVNDVYYREALELLAQAVEHHLQKRLTALPA